MNIAYLVLAHQHPRLLVRLIRRLLGSGGSVVLHVDRNAGDRMLEEVRELLGPDFSRILLAERVPVVWGEWSLVQAALNGLTAIAEASQTPDYVYLLSGSDYPIRPLEELGDFLERNRGTEYIESFCDREHRWVTDGIQSERYLYRFPFNWGKNPRLFSLTLKLQQMLHWKRKRPAGIDPHFGSQWWVLTWASCRAILDLCRDPALLKFFRGTWVPDELFFQTLIRKVARPERVHSHTLTLYQFTPTGTPVVYCNGHGEYLARQNFFFARKISPWAEKLRDELDAVARGERQQPPLEDRNAGQRTPDYENHCRTGGQGIAGRAVIGRPGPPPLGDLVWNDRPYLVVAGFAPAELGALQSFLDELDGFSCHGQLFQRREIGFRAGVRRYAGFSRQDQRLRDDDIPGFLMQVLQEDAGQVTGFLLDLNRQARVLRLLAHDSNARVLLLRGDPVRAFRETELARSASGSRRTHPRDTAQAALRGLFDRYGASCQRTLRDLDRLFVRESTRVLPLVISGAGGNTTFTGQHVRAFCESGPAGDMLQGTEPPLEFSTGLSPTDGLDALRLATAGPSPYIGDAAAGDGAGHRRI